MATNPFALTPEEQRRLQIADANRSYIQEFGTFDSELDRLFEKRQLAQAWESTLQRSAERWDAFQAATGGVKVFTALGSDAPVEVTREAAITPTLGTRVSGDQNVQTVEAGAVNLLNIITKRAGGQDLSQYERVIHWKPQKGLNVGIGVDAQGQQHELYRYSSGGSSLLKTAVMGTLAVLGGMAASSIIGGAFAGGASGSAAGGSAASSSAAASSSISGTALSANMSVAPWATPLGSPASLGLAGTSAASASLAPWAFSTGLPGAAAAGTASSLLAGAKNVLGKMSGSQWLQAAGAASSLLGARPAPPTMPGVSMQVPTRAAAHAAAQDERRRGLAGRFETILTSGQGLLTKPRLGRATLLGH